MPCSSRSGDAVSWSSSRSSASVSMPSRSSGLGALVTGEGFRECHIAFAAPTRAAVREFFAAATRFGVHVLHKPRLWPEYHPNYYAAFARDPDGNNVEAVCHLPE